MSRHDQPSRKRRTFLKGLGGIGLVGALSGCTGGGGGDGGGSDGGGGGDGGGDGSGGGGAGGGDGPPSDDTERMMRSALPPSGFYLPVLDYFEREDVPNEEFRKHGFEGVELQATWDDATLFAADKVDFSHGNCLEGTATAVNQGWKMTYFGNGLAGLGGLMVAAGGDYDPATTGSVQASLDKLVEDDATFCHWGWNSGTLLNANVVMQAGYGYSVQEDGGDFSDVVVTNAPGAVSPLILRGDVDVGLTDPIHAGKGLPQMVDGEVVPLWFNINKFAELDLGFPTVNDFGLKQEVYNEYPEAAEAYAAAWDRGFNWMYEMSESGELPAIAAPLEGFPASNEEEAQFLIDVYILGEKWFDYSAIPRDCSYTEAFIAAEQKYLRRGVDLGVVPENWEEVAEWKIHEGYDNPVNPNAFPL